MADENEPQTEAATPEPDEMERIQALVQALSAENVELKDQRLRALAELENTRRRAEREKQDASQYAVTRFARDDVVLTLIKDGDHRLSRPEDIERLLSAVKEF